MFSYNFEIASGGVEDSYIPYLVPGTRGDETHLPYGGPYHT